MEIGLKKSTPAFEISDFIPNALSFFFGSKREKPELPFFP